MNKDKFTEKADALVKPMSNNKDEIMNRCLKILNAEGQNAKYSCRLNKLGELVSIGAQFLNNAAPMAKITLGQLQAIAELYDTEDVTMTYEYGALGIMSTLVIQLQEKGEEMGKLTFSALTREKILLVKRALGEMKTIKEMKEVLAIHESEVEELRQKLYDKENIVKLCVEVITSRYEKIREHFKEG